MCKNNEAHPQRNNFHVKQCCSTENRNSKENHKPKPMPMNQNCCHNIIDPIVESNCLRELQHVQSQDNFHREFAKDMEQGFYCKKSNGLDPIYTPRGAQKNVSFNNPMIVNDDLTKLSNKLNATSKCPENRNCCPTNKIYRPETFRPVNFNFIAS